MSIYFLLCFSFLLPLSFCQEASPCPRYFTYEPKTEAEPDRWYGLITLLHDTELNGVWLRIVFDKPILQLGNWFGEVVKKNQTDYLVKNPNFKLHARTPKVIRIFVRYHMHEDPPKIMEFRLNARVICPEDLFTTTTTTTTERLFTSAEGEYSAYEGQSQQISYTPATEHYTYNQLSMSTRKPANTVNQNIQEICGTVEDNHHRNDRHIGQVAQKGEFPWHAMLYYTKDITIAYLCGASLVSHHHLVTVAHCVIKSQSQVPINPERLVVYLGKYYVKHWSHEGTQTHYVADITPHPEYNSETYDNDIAVLRLHSSVEFTDFVRPICLWKEAEDFNLVSKRPGTVVGWGFDETGKIEDKLMFVQMFPQSYEVCNKSIVNYEQRFVSRKTFCANFIDDTVECVGDSGGAMVFPKITQNRAASVWQLRGLVTVSVVLQHKLDCGTDLHVVFTDVAKYHDWIRECTNLE